jgi:hypothetical protein
MKSKEVLSFLASNKFYITRNNIIFSFVISFFCCLLFLNHINHYTLSSILITFSVFFIFWLFFISFALFLIPKETDNQNITTFKKNKFFKWVKIAGTISALILLMISIYYHVWFLFIAIFIAITISSFIINNSNKPQTIIILSSVLSIAPIITIVFPLLFLIFWRTFLSIMFKGSKLAINHKKKIKLKD